MTNKPLNQYSHLPLLPGLRTDFTKPLILELFDSGQGKEVIELLYMVDLKVKEKATSPGFILTTSLGEPLKKVNGGKR